jgi:hypothetical protein
LADGRIAINTNTASPGLFFKDSAGTGIVKVGPVHVGTTAPNSVPASGGSTGNYTGEQWLDTSVSPAQMKVWNGSTWVGIVADELPVSKLQDGAARQLIQTDAAGTGVEWTSNVDVPGTLDVTSTATFDSIARHPLGTAGAPTITFTGNTNTGIYSPGTNQVAISTNGVQRMNIEADGDINIDSGGVFYDATNNRLAIGTTSPATTLDVNGDVTITDKIIHGGDTNTAIRFPAADTVSVETDGNERARIDSSGRLLVGTSSSTNNIAGQTNIALVTTGSGNAGGATLTTYPGTTQDRSSSIAFQRSRGTTDGSMTAVALGDRLGDLVFSGSDGTSFQSGARINAFVDGTVSDVNNSVPARIVFSTTADGASSPMERMRITNAGRVGIGTQGPASLCSVEGGNIALQSPGSSLGVRTTERLFLRSDLGSTNGMAAIGMNGTGTNGFLGEIKFYTGLSDVFNASLSERARIDSSGRLLVGTSSGLGDNKLQVQGDANSSGIFLRRDLPINTIGANVGLYLATINFGNQDGAIGASIRGETDATWSSNDYPSRLVFSTTADGASSPTERMRITSSGELLVGTSSAVNNADLQAANSISVGGTIKREVSKRLNLADNTSTTLFTFQIPGGGSQSHRTYVGGEISYIVAVGRETSSRNSRTTYGKVYFSIDRFWESNANNPVSVNLIDTDKSLSTSNGSAPTITWAITTDAGIDNAAKNVYLAITVDNPFTNTIQTNITGTISYHTLSFSDVTLS